MEIEGTKSVDVGQEYRDERAKRLRELEKACRDFEAIFLSMVLREMKNAFPSEGPLIPKGFAEDLFTDMFYEEISRRISETQGIGLWKALFESLKGSL